MNTLIPLEYYYQLYINLCLFLVLFTLLHTRVVAIDNSKNVTFINIAGWFLLVFLVFYMGLRPLNGVYFGDTVNYYKSFVDYKYGKPIPEDGDLGWELFIKFMSYIVNIHTFFTLMVFVYIFPMYYISKIFFKEYWYYAFIMFIVSFSFWSYGVNGVRNGVACSLFLWGLAFKDKKIIMAILFFIAIMFHKTLLLPIMAYLATYVYNKPKAYFIGWLACIPMSLVAGGFFTGLFAKLGFADERLTAYLTGSQDAGSFSSTGFRWDFLFYSGFAVFAGWYFVFKKKFDDKIYNQLLNTYLICNGFWILVIKANFSNRFAYLSWFMMAIVIIYPFLKERFFKDQHFMIGKVVLAYFAFTYLMFYVYYY
ncbi:MAG: EpsG family protein [Flavobacteriaceae bacterium]